MKRLLLHDRSLDFSVSHWSRILSKFLKYFSWLFVVDVYFCIHLNFSLNH
jgi:hypothetical protein